MTTSKVFNPETLLHHTEQDEELAYQLASMGKDDMPDFLEKAEQQFEENLSSEAARSLHSLKGVAGALGAERLFENSLECEMLLKEGGDREETACCLKQIRREMESLFSDPQFLRFSNDGTL